jgi:hypothetical protein
MNEIINAETGEIEGATTELVALPPSAKMTRVSLVIPDDTTYEEWEEIGKQLRHMEGAIQWAVGDWLNFGERKYGEKYAQAVEITGYVYNALVSQKWVSGRFELTRRRVNLSWSHHVEVARLAPFQQDKMLDRAIAEGWTRNELRDQVAEEYPRDKPELTTPKFFSWYHEARVAAGLEGWKAVSEMVGVLIGDQRDPENARYLLEMSRKTAIEIVETTTRVLGDEQ